MKSIISLIFLWVCYPLQASSSVNVSGFGTIGLVVTDSDEFGYRSDFSRVGGVFDSEFDFAQTSNLGLQFDIIANSSFDAVVQVIYREQEEYSLDSMVNLAFVRYTPTADWSVRIGRTALDLFLLTEFRDIGFAYPWAHVPSEIYGIVPHRHLDGLDITYRRPAGNGTFSAKMFYGESEYGVTGFSSSNVTPLNLDNIVGLALDYQTFDWDIALNHTQVKFDSTLITPLANGLRALSIQVPIFEQFWPSVNEVAAGIDLNNQTGKYTSVSGQYRAESMTFMTELAQINADSLTVQDMHSGYFSGVYHTDLHNFFFSIAYSETKQYEVGAVDLAMLQNIPFATDLYFEALGVLGFFNVNQKTLSLGWRWDFSDNMSFKLQWDHTRIDNGGSTLWQPPEPGGNFNEPVGKVNALFSNLSFTF
ncbi:hypothetical protein [Planctobacterium marinum]|uniref:hypothetical protein n=1 Tax=Planctobacterium marinum TaxID=1631968 RepID=UPI001E568907|nr:hypothetical protein [Planctobacterium marinum]MCC2604266.1 hypothetical protein [Planctobacterium marinum]